MDFCWYGYLKCHVTTVAMKRSFKKLAVFEVIPQCSSKETKLSFSGKGLRHFGILARFLNITKLTLKEHKACDLCMQG